MPFKLPSTTLTIEFQGPFNWFNVFDNQLVQKKGIYIWSIPYQEKQLVYYIGVTGVTFYYRLKQHIQGYLSGEYRIFNPELFKQGKKELIYGGLWKKDRQDKMSEYLKKYEELYPKIIEFLKTMNLYLCPLDCKTRIFERIEGAIGTIIKEKSLLDEDIIFRPRRKDEEPLKVEIKNNLFYYIPNKFEA